jgi:hypothetical protein
MTTDILRPIIGIENRTAQEVFDIMCDRFSHRQARSLPGEAFDLAVNALRQWSGNHLSAETNQFLRIVADDLEKNKAAIFRAALPSHQGAGE